MERLSGGEPSWVLLTETTPDRAVWLTDRLAEEGIASDRRNGDAPVSRRALLPRPTPIVWIVVLAPDLDRARRIVEESSNDGPLGLVIPDTFPRRARAWARRRRRVARPGR